MKNFNTLKTTPVTARSETQHAKQTGCLASSLDQKLTMIGYKVIEAIVRSLNEYLQRACPERYVSPFKIALHGYNCEGGRLTPYNGHQPPTIVDVGRQNDIDGAWTLTLEGVVQS